MFTVTLIKETNNQTFSHETFANPTFARNHAQQQSKCGYIAVISYANLEYGRTISSLYIKGVEIKGQIQEDLK